MDWPYVLIMVVGSLLALMATGMPVAVAFMIVNIAGLSFLMGMAGLEQLTSSIFSSISTFILLPVPMFILMGEVLFRAGLAKDVLDAVDMWLGRLPGRLSLLSALVGALFGTFTGASVATTAMLGSTLVPQMSARGYKKPMSLGPIVGSGGLAMLIPPSGLAVLLGAIGQVSIGDILVAIVIPGIVLAGMYSVYIITRARMQPHLAPPYEVSANTMRTRINATVKYILPLGVLLFLVLGLIILGVATPSESAATGAMGAVALVLAYGRGRAQVFVTAMLETVKLTGMIFLVIAGATAFSQVLSFTGATHGMAEFVIELPAPPIVLVGIMILVVLFMGSFMGPVAIMLITLPLFVPAVSSLGYDPVWFAVIYLLAVEMSFTTPPYGPNLFVLKAVVADATFRDVAGAAVPFLLIDAVLVLLLMAWPTLALWLPAQMG